jgi:hypothetical protein
MLGESLRQNFLQSGAPETVMGLQATNAAMTSVQKELTTVLHNLSDSHGAVAQVEYANNRLGGSLESRTKAMDTLLHEWKSDLLRIWIPLVAGTAMLIGLFVGIEIQGRRDAVSTAAGTPTPSVVQPTPSREPETDVALVGNPKRQYERRDDTKKDAGHER